MHQLESIRAELTIQGIRVDGKKCYTYEDGAPASRDISEQIAYLQKHISQNKRMVLTFWKEMSQFVSKQDKSAVALSSESMRKVFISSSIRLYKLSKRFKSLTVASSVLKKLICSDCLHFSETFMSKVIDFALAIEWIHHLIRHDMYRIDLLRELNKHTDLTVANAGGIYGTFPLEMRERVWSYAEDEEDRDDAAKSPEFAFWHHRHELPETYNKPDQFEEGFVWREIRNDPYEFDDDSSNPYPHRNVLYKGTNNIYREQQKAGT